MKSVRVDYFIVPSLGLVLVLGLLNITVTDGDEVGFLLLDGDNVTCIPFASQTSFKNQTGSPHSNQSPTTVIIPGNSTDTTYGVERARQTIALDAAGACPDGTIPVRRGRGIWSLAQSRLLRRRTGQTTPQSAKDTDDDFAPHEYAYAEMKRSKQSQTAYKGTEVLINVWDPYVDSSEEFSLAQLWILATDDHGILNTIEAGYQVSTGHYGDGLPRLFVYWTADGYDETGCYDLDCPGFVQVSKEVLIGGSFATISSTLGQQYEIKLRVFKDDQTGDWWLQLNDEIVGYWPQSLFTGGLRGMAQKLEWGAEIVDDESSDGNHHTSTQMGSGAFASAGFQQAAYIRNMQYIDGHDTLRDAPISVHNTSASCYSVQRERAFKEWGSYFFYGGQGYGPYCKTHTGDYY